MTIRKPLGPDPIRFTMRSSKNPVNAGEEFEITLTAELLPILPSQLFFFDQQKTFRLKLLLPKGAQQTGGTYYDLIGETLKPDGLNQLTYTWQGTLASGDSTGCFRLLREVSSASDQALFIEKSQLCVQIGDLPLKDSIAIQPKADVSASKARTSACSAPRVSWAGNSTSISLSWVAEDNPNFTSSDAPATLQAQTCSGTTKWYQRQADNTGLLVASGSSYTYVTHNYIAAQDVTYRYYATCVCADGESSPSVDFPITITRKAIILIPTSTTACEANGIRTPLTVQGCPTGAVIKFYNSVAYSWTMASTGTTSVYNAYGGVQPDTYQASCIFKGVEGPRSNSTTITSNCVTDPCAGVGTPSAPSIHQYGNTLTSLNVCYDGGLNLIANEGCTGTIKWYRQSDNAEMATGTTYNPDHIHQSVNYYATCSNDCHTSNTSNLIIITVITAANTPTIYLNNHPNTTSQTICRNTGVSLWAEGCSNGVKWYKNGDYATTVGDGNPFTSENLSDGATFTARCKDTNGCGDSGNSNTFTVGIKDSPSAPSAHQDGTAATSFTFCNSSSVIGLRADGCTGTVKWYTQSNNTQVGTGVTYVANAATQSINYYATCTTDCGVSPASNLLQVVVQNPPAAPSAHQDGTAATSFTFCNSSSVIGLRADGCTGTVKWYTQSNNTQVGTGVTYVANAATQSINYYATCTTDCGVSPASNLLRVFVTSTSSLTLTARVAGTSSAQSLTLSASGCPAGSTVLWSGPNNTTATGSSWLIASFTQTSTYSAQCQSSTACPSSAQIIVNYVMPNTPIIRTTATQVCAGQSVTLTADGCQTGTTVLWSGGQMGASLVLTPTATATYKAYCAVGEVVGDPSTQLGVTVLSSHTVTISGSTTYAVGETISLSAVSSASGSVTYRWSGPNNFTSTAQNPSIPTATTAMSGTYTVVATNATSCTATASYALRVDASDISCSCQDCDAPEWQTDVIAVGNANTGTTYNSVVVDTYLSPTSSVGGTTERSQQIVYLDGFGRPLQTIQTGASPTGKDVVVPVEYDGFGRVTKNYLPYTDATGGSFKANALTTQAGFYSGLKGDAAAYAETLLEASPLQRVTQQGSIGSAWQPNATDANKTGVVKATYRISFETTIPKLVFAYTTGNTWTLSRYAAKQLFVNETKDANNNTVVAFTDILGQTVCKKVYNGTDVLTTYYAYDDFGRLCLTFPPKAAQKLESQSDGSINFTTTDAFKDQIYWYVYDARGRVVEKKTSDATIEEMVYNLHDQVVLYRNGLHRKQNQWLYSKYDELGRMVRKGVYASANSRTVEQTNVNNSFAPAPVFSDAAYPTSGLTELSRSYYDDYAFTTKKSPDQPTEFGLGALATEAGPVKLIGKLTGTQETVLKASGATATAKTTLLTTYYYDQYGRQVQTRQENHLSGEDLSSVRLDFAGRVLETKLTTSAFSKTTNVWTRNTYTRNNQLKMTCQRINDGIKEPVGRYSYNELGEMTEKWQGCKMQVITYQTDIRGRLTGINSSDPVQLKANKQFFGLKLEYSLDDNISAQEWGSVPNLRAGATLPAKRRFDYTYDPIGRIQGASYSGGTSENFSVSGITYDLNGNLLSMNRRVQTPTLTDSPNEDKLTYAYAPNTNQLRNVIDKGRVTPDSPKKAHYFTDRNLTADDGIHTGFTAADDYAYDEAGNLVRDLNRDIRNIDYNVLGLPETITFGNQTKIYYLYTGGGNKLQKQGAYLPTNQAGQYAQKQIDYAGGLVYTEQAISFIPTAEGRALPPLSGATTTDYRYEYQQTDQLGNLRSACRCGEKFDANGNLVPTTGSEDPRTVVQENHFDPWGLNLADIETQPGSSTDLWQFNSGSEKAFGLDGSFLYDTDFRQYDPTIGRFNGVDKLVDLSTGINPFVFGFNNPNNFNDPTGLYSVSTSASPISYGPSPNSIIGLFSSLKMAFSGIQVPTRVGTAEVYTMERVIDRDHKYYNSFSQGMLGRSVNLRKNYLLTDSPKDAQKNNTYVNYSSYFEYADINIPEEILVKYMMGNLVKGTGPENYRFPKDGYISNKFRGSHIVDVALSNFYEKNSNAFETKSSYSNLVGTSSVADFGFVEMVSGIMKSGFPPKTILDMVGSAYVTVIPQGRNLTVDIFNITSVSSGDFLSKPPIFKKYVKVPKSIVRNPSGKVTPYGNISQRFQLTFSIDEVMKKYGN